MERITRQEMYIKMAHLMSLRGTCVRAQVGCIIVNDGRVVSSGYVGSPPGFDHCIDVGCELGPEGGCISTVHAELNAILYAARKGISLEGGIMYCTHNPCRKCAQAILSVGIKEFYYYNGYRDSSGLKLLGAGGVKIGKVQEPGMY